ncbi:hypothetical protein IEQ34_011750 [Dendrobium chrysotoxum]|uniref:Protein-serine/threonine phosphatase n=1 Tax=Dendrobium chrysotoxum TaxID=161865 RepID=A0AAV7GQP5_DENCH|nr:hypothetical protein IEQ34_011750 [Dendrobium chrysotoxum]
MRRDIGAAERDVVTRGVGRSAGQQGSATGSGASQRVCISFSRILIAVFIHGFDRAVLHSLDNCNLDLRLGLEHLWRWMLNCLCIFGAFDRLRLMMMLVLYWSRTNHLAFNVFHPIQRWAYISVLLKLTNFLKMGRINELDMVCLLCKVGVQQWKMQERDQVEGVGFFKNSTRKENYCEHAVIPNLDDFTSFFGVYDGHGATGGQERGGNPIPFRGGENEEVEILDGEDGMPSLEPISREEMSIGYEQKGAEFARRGVDYERRGVDFERRGDFEEGFGY